jgi:hypothetical protein
MKSKGAGRSRMEITGHHIHTGKSAETALLFFLSYQRRLITRDLSKTNN